MFYDYVKAALELFKNAENEFSSFQNLEQGEIKIGVSTTLTKVCLLEAIENFHRDYPNIEIILTNDLTSNLVLELEKGKLDFVIYNEGTSSEKNIKKEIIRQIHQGFIYNEKYFSDEIKSFKDLVNIPIIIQKKESNSRKYIDSILKDKNIFLKPKIETVSQDLVIELTRIGLGIGYTITDLIKNDPKLKELNLNKQLPPINIILGTNKHIKLTSAANKFLSYLKK